MKLVRNRIPEVIEREGKQVPPYYLADPDELESRLYEKLKEEIAEFKDSPSAEEAADILEALRTLCWIHKISMDSVQTEAERKRESKGGFHRGVVLEVAGEAP